MQHTVVSKQFLQDVYMDMLSSKITKKNFSALWILIFFQFSENFLKTAEISAPSDFQVHGCAVCVHLSTSIFCKHPQKFAKLLPKKIFFHRLKNCRTYDMRLGGGGGNLFTPPPRDLNSRFSRHCREMLSSSCVLTVSPDTTISICPSAPLSHGAVR